MSGSDPLATAGPPPEHEVKALLREAGVAVPRGATAASAEGVAAAAGGLTPPLVLKAFGPGLVHKSDSGAVRLALAGPAEAAGAAAEMLGGLLAQGITPDGFLVEEQADPGVELIVGVVRDPGFGPVLLAGLGGVWTEALRDTAVRVCPVSEADARRMLASLRGSRLLRGYRGRPAADMDALVKLLLTIGGAGGLWERLELGEFELNPVIATGRGAVAVDARYIPGGPREEAPRPAPAAETDFTALFEPRAVAVVGASASRPNFGNMFLEFYRATGVPLVAVHPEADEIDGVPAVPTLADADADYALVAVPAGRCAEVVRQADGIPFVQVMSGGFGEAGAPELEAGLVRAAREAGTRLLGPNCMGVYSPRGGQTFIGGEPGPPGHVALISQSGGLAGEVVRVGERRGLAFSRVATVGNSADVTPAELLRWLATDEHTSVVGMYLEDPRGGRALFEALMSVRGRLPVVLLVGGRSAQGRRAAASHTGGMVGDDRVWRALAEQSGAALVTGQDDLIGVLSFFQSHARRLSALRTDPADGDPGGDPALLVIGPSGGASVLAADVFDAAGLSLDALPEEAEDGLKALGIGVGSSLANPLEIPVGPRGRPELAREAIAAIVARRPYPDVVAHVNVQSFFTYGSSAEPLYACARSLARAQEDLPEVRITLVTRNGECAPPGVEDGVRAIAAGAGIPVYRSMEAAAVAVAAAKRFTRGA
ncbi:acetate--CoA ligase family protein [Streptosporangium roseum]|uniref:CoA-binding domain protein n=1 Tax=Streptosporangium roseum (strain ATCC 12428 / DSM 43021 / JCM 3005 / KCTC 9067 / NCIMB 10171 / NRRL 2505 / NI 9100) TaxID=479432 RepID=D2AW26_STRRD|nr:acetate--CoA ligase family protein [Streptosporangium roseum]ACZ84979.1 CoA-binding domain protein [Streptosporangium roseum DSM 43021]